MATHARGAAQQPAYDFNFSRVARAARAWARASDGGAGAEDVDWVFYNPQSRGDKKPKDSSRNSKELNAITKAIWHHMAAGATNGQVPGKGNSAHLWQRLKVVYFQHSALDFQYAEPLDALATYFGSVTYSTFWVDQEEWFC